MLDFNGELAREKILRRYRHIINDMYHHEERYPHKWMQPEGNGAARTSQPATGPDMLRGQSRPDQKQEQVESVSQQLQSLDKQIAAEVNSLNQSPPGTRAAESSDKLAQWAVDNYKNAGTQAEEKKKEDLTDMLAQYFSSGAENLHPAMSGNITPQKRNTSAAAGSASPAGTYQTPQGSHYGSARGRSPRDRLPAPGLIVEGASHNAAPDRGRYSPSFSMGNYRPYDKSGGGLAGAGAPGGQAVLGLPVGGANISGIVDGCMPAQMDQSRRPPRPNNSLHKRSPSPTMYGKTPTQAASTSKGEWSF
mmetsp:Transcript_18475/g.28833  ORF Transcript_18475/g.28833 Transcript_18475/m.28833 type:complete len:306 (+) Transcript_18475:2-919(+)